MLTTRLEILLKKMLSQVKPRVVFRQVSAVGLMLAIMIPIAVPIPIWAYDLNFPPMPQNYGLELGSESSSISNPSLDFMSNLLESPAALFGSASDDKTEAPDDLADSNRENLEKKVVDIHTAISDGQQVTVGKAISLAAMPLDKDANPVNGLSPVWRTSTPDILKIDEGTLAITLRSGFAKLSVSSGEVKKEFTVNVLPNRPKIRFSNRTAKSVSRPVTEPTPEPFEPEMQEAEANILVTPENNLGNPLGQSELSSRTSAVAGTRERYGSSNFSFDISAASISGRGLDAGVGITYNSRVWTKSTISDQTNFEYNANRDWLGPGFEIGFGSIEGYGTSSDFGYLLTAPDGTRSQLTLKSTVSNCSTFESTDGTFIQTTICGAYGSTATVVKYPDGTQVTYDVTGNNKRYPTRIRDRNGNFITIAYLQNDAVGKIDYIQDTLNRYIDFHYDTTTENKLVAITVPGMTGSSTPRQTIRFYYEDLTLQTSGQFETPVTVVAPSSVKVLRYIYFPGTHTGFRYDYSPYFGIIYKIWQLRGMSVSSNSLTATGSVDNHQTGDPLNWAAMTHYNYPATAMDLASPLTDVPKYSWRKDDWQGRTSAIPQTSFQSVEDVTPSSCDISAGTCTGTRTTTITAPDGSRNISVSKIVALGATNAWENGLLDEIRIETGASPVKLWSKTKLYWEKGDNQPGGRANPRLKAVETTNDADQTRGTSFEYDDYNNQTKIREHDFDDPGDPDDLGAELRRTETTYETGTDWINSGLLRLPKEVKTIVGSNVVSKIKYEYDNYSGSNALENTSGVVQHDRVFNPFNPPNPGTHECNCKRVCDGGGENFAPNCPDGSPWIRVCESCPNPAIPINFHRGNVTKVIAFPDTSAADNDPNNAVRTMKYDITGNVIASSGGCSCDITTATYSSGSYYAYATSSTMTGEGGLISTTSATYDIPTGLVTEVRDENNQPTTVTYDPDNLRVIRTDEPNGAWATTDYNDSTYPYYVKTTTSLDATRSISSWSFTNGLGQMFRSRRQTDGGYISTDVKFDVMGRVAQSYNPYTVTTLEENTIPSGTKYSELLEVDGLGRTLQSKLPDNTVVSASFNGLVATVKDQAGKMRRQIADALGRTIRVDEPVGVPTDPQNPLGPVASPYQPTYYDYDGNDNLIKVTQSDGITIQERVFKYDSLSRLTHEKQVEATATLNDSGVKQTSGGTWTSVYKYNSDGVLVEGIDARGVKMTLGYDGFNRVKSITYSGETGYKTPNVMYTYDEAESGFYNKGRLTKVETEVNTTYEVPATIQIYRYDKIGQVVRHTQSIGSQTYGFEYGYNLAGQLVSEKYPSGKIVSMTVDNFGRLATVADAEHIYLSSASFNNRGLLSQLNLGNGTNENFSYNDRFQMVSQSLTKDSNMLQKYDYGYGQLDGNGNLDVTKNNGQLARIESFIGTNKQAVQKFKYDELGRLKESAEYRGDNNNLTYKQVFDFDRFGNLYRKTANNPTAGQQNPIAYSPIEEATAPGTGDIDKSTNRFRTDTTYDEAGAVVSDTKFRNMNFKYDANGRMVKAQNIANSANALTVYDALGNRVATKINDVWQYTIYDAFGQLVAEYGQAADGLGGVRYIQQDWQGSVRTVTNVHGFVVSRTDHQAFGGDVGYGVGQRSIELGYNRGASTRQGYGMTERDEATGLDHTWFRKNESSAGRWTRPDPYNGSISVENPQSHNRYSYVTNDPIGYIDPSGLQGTSLDEGIGAAQDALESSLCRNFLRSGGSFGSRDPRDVLNAYKNQGFLSSGREYASKRKSNGNIKMKGFRSGVGAVTAFGFRGGLNLGGALPISAPYITVNTNGFYFSLKTPNGTDVETLEEFTGLTDAEIRGSVILHELAHAFNAIPSDGKDSKKSRANSEKIKKMCFSAAARIFRPRHEVITTTPIVLGGGEITPRSPISYGGGFPWWYWSLQSFLNDLYAIEVGGGTVTVTACVGSDCAQ